MNAILNLSMLSASLKSGDNSVLEPIFRQHQHYCINKLMCEKNCPREEAEDIYVEAILNLRSKIITDQIAALTNVKSYLAQTCVNMYFVRIKQQQRWNKHIPDVERFFYQSDYVLNEEDYDFEEAMAVTRAVWSKMKEKCKDIIHYFYIDRLKMDEISRLMGFSNANVVKTTKSRCLKKMQDLANELQQPKTES